MSPYSISIEWLFAVLVAAAAVLYLREGRRSGFRRSRAISFGAGLAIVLAALCSPIETLSAHYLLSIHMLQNVMITDWAPPLLVFGAAPAWRGVSPRIALPLWLAAWYGVHLPGAYDFALRHPWALNLQHAVLIAAGIVFWWPVVTRGAMRTPLILAYLGIAFATSTFLGLALIFSTSPFYDFYRHVPRLWGLSPVHDQNLGGILMNAEQTVIFLGAIAYFLLRMFDEEEHRASARAR